MPSTWSGCIGRASRAFGRVEQPVEHLERAGTVAFFDGVRELVRGHRAGFAEVGRDVVGVEGGAVAVRGAQHVDERTDAPGILTEVRR